MNEKIEHLLRHDSEIYDDFWDLAAQGSDRLEFQGVAFVWGCVMVLVGAIFAGPSLFRGQIDFYGGLGLFVLGTGILAFFARSRVVLDRRAGILEYRRVGLLSPGQMRLPLKDFCQVRLGREFIQSETTRGEGYSLIVVDLLTEAREAFRLGAKRDVSDEAEITMRQRAELLTSFLQVNLRDQTGEEELVLDPHEVQQNLAQRLGGTPPEMEPPNVCTLEIVEGSILLPAEGWTPINRHLRGLAFGFTGVSGILFSGSAYALGSDHQDPFLWAFASVSGLLFLGSFGFLRSSKDRAFKQDKLCFQEESLVHFSQVGDKLIRVAEAQYDEILEVRREERQRSRWSQNEPPIRIISRSGMLQFGNELTKADSDWLMRELQRRIVLRTPGA